MALENINEIEKAFGLEEGKLSEMITSEEKHSINLSELIIEPKSIYEERLTNIKTHSGIMAREIAVKKVRDAFGLDFQGKNEDNLIEALKGRDEQIKSEVIKDPEERYTSLKSDFEKLQGNLNLEIQKRTELETSYSKKEKETKIKNDVYKHIPDNTVVGKSTILLEANEKGYSFDDVDGKTVVKNASGEVIKDERTLSPISIEDWAKTFVTPYLKPVEGGGGGGDDVPPSKAGSFEAFEKEASKNGWTAMQKNTEMAKRIKEGTLSL
jgi:hypothetical protein